MITISLSDHSPVVKSEHGVILLTERRWVVACGVRLSQVEDLGRTKCRCGKTLGEDDRGLKRWQLRIGMERLIEIEHTKIIKVVRKVHYPNETPTGHRSELIGLP